jgi:hypothetical protein
MDERPEQPPEGKLIADALTRSGMSIRKASKQAGISYGRWRQITSGYQNVSPGSYARVTAPADTLARMAAVVSVTPEQLEEAGRPDAAGSLRSGSARPPSTGRGVTAAEENLILEAAEVLRRRREALPHSDPGLEFLRKQYPGLVLPPEVMKRVREVWGPDVRFDLETRQFLTVAIVEKAAGSNGGETEKYA